MLRCLVAPAGKQHLVEDVHGRAHATPAAVAAGAAADVRAAHAWAPAHVRRMSSDPKSSDTAPAVQLTLLQTSPAAAHLVIGRLECLSACLIRS